MLGSASNHFYKNPDRHVELETLVQLHLILKNLIRILFTLFGTHTRAYRSLIVLQLPPRLLTPTVNV